MGQPPYGYMKDPDNPKRWIVDDKAAKVVKRIYGMTLMAWERSRLPPSLNGRKF